MVKKSREITSVDGKHLFEAERVEERPRALKVSPQINIIMTRLKYLKSILLLSTAIRTSQFQNTSLQTPSIKKLYYGDE